MDYSQIDFSPLWISLKTGIVASLVSFVLGILAAWFVVSRRGRTRGIWDGILTMPLVLPPTVAGYILLRIFSTRHSFGNFVDKGLSIHVIHTWLGCIIAATVIAFPLMYRNARAAFEQDRKSVV